MWNQHAWQQQQAALQWLGPDQHVVPSSEAELSKLIWWGLYEQALMPILSRKILQQRLESLGRMAEVVAIQRDDL